MQEAFNISNSFDLLHMPTIWHRTRGQYLYKCSVPMTKQESKGDMSVKYTSRGNKASREAHCLHLQVSNLRQYAPPKRLYAPYELQYYAKHNRQQYNNQTYILINV